MTFDPQTVGSGRSPTSNNACLLMTSLCYVICKDSEFLNIFHNFYFETWNDPLNDPWPRWKILRIVAICTLIIHTNFSWNRIKHVAVETFFVKSPFLTPISRSKVKSGSNRVRRSWLSQWSLWPSLVTIRWTAVELLTDWQKKKKLVLRRTQHKPAAQFCSEHQNLTFDPYNLTPESRMKFNAFFRT